MPTPGEYYIAVYAEEELRGWLLIADRDANGSLVPVRNAYRLKREGARWTADGGHGGLGTDKTMSRFATRLFQYLRYRVRVTAGSCIAARNP
jgi:hypothetical protein